MSDEILHLRLAGSDEIRSWSSGQIWTVRLLNDERRRPAAGGLFCEGIFGLVRDRKARQERMGHIELTAPVVHPWAWQLDSSPLARLLGLTQAELEKVVHCQAFLVLNPGPTGLARGHFLDDKAQASLQIQYREALEVETGARAIRHMLQGLTLPSGEPAEKLVLDCIPVVPPALRPLRLSESRVVQHNDLNTFYLRILNRDHRLRKLYELSAPLVIIRNEVRMLQQCVDALFDNQSCRHRLLGRGRRPLRSLADRIERRLKRDLTRRHTDYSGRAPVVVDPALNPRTCGLPRSLARVLYRPFILHHLLALDYATTRAEAEALLTQPGEEVDDALSEALRCRPVLLNLRAFDPILVEDDAIHLHPLMLHTLELTPGQAVTVHLPLSNQARAEASLLLRPTDPGMPEPGLRHDALLGCYLLTADPPEGMSPRLTGTPEQILQAHDQGRLGLRDPVRVLLPLGSKVRIEQQLDEPVTGEQHQWATTVGRVLFHLELPSGTPFHNFPLTAKALPPLLVKCDPRATERIQRLCVQVVTRLGVSIGLGDLRPPSEREHLLAELQREEARIERQYDRGMICPSERRSRAIDLRWHTSEQLARQLLDEMRHEPENVLHAMAHSGAAGGLRELRHLLASGPLPTTADSALLDLPALSPWAKGLGQWEYFLASLRARRDRMAQAQRRRRLRALTRWLCRRMVTAAGIRAALAIGRACESLSDYVFTFGLGTGRSRWTQEVRSVPQAQSRAITLLMQKGLDSLEERLAELKEIFERDSVPVEANDLELILRELATPKGFLARASHGDVRTTLFQAALANQSDPLEHLRELTLLGRLIPDEEENTNRGGTETDDR